METAEKTDSHALFCLCRRFILFYRCSLYNEPQPYASTTLCVFRKTPFLTFVQRSFIYVIIIFPNAALSRIPAFMFKISSFYFTKTLLTKERARAILIHDRLPSFDSYPFKILSLSYLLICQLTSIVLSRGACVECRGQLLELTAFSLSMQGAGIAAPFLRRNGKCTRRNSFLSACA